MKGSDNRQSRIFRFVPIEKQIRAGHPLRTILELVDEIVIRLAPEFRELYSTTGRPLVAPERLLRVLPLQIS